MNRVVVWVQNFLLREILTVFLIGIIFFLFQAFVFWNQLEALAETQTPNASAYQVDRFDADTKEQIQNDNPLVENARRNLKENADTVREKLNLDQPIRESTKDFVNSDQKQVKETFEPITENKRGYYQDNNLAR